MGRGQKSSQSSFWSGRRPPWPLVHPGHGAKITFLKIFLDIEEKGPN